MTTIQNDTGVWTSFPVAACEKGEKVATSNEYLIVSWAIGTYVDYARENYVTNKFKNHVWKVGGMFASFFAFGLIATGIGIALLQTKTSIVGGSILISIGAYNIILSAIWSSVIVRNISRGYERSIQWQTSASQLYQSSADIPNEMKEEKKNLLRNAFLKFDNTDIFFLQESYEITADEWNEILPEDYTFFNYGHGLIAWKSSRFSLLAQVEISYPLSWEDSPKNKDTIIQLQDTSNQITICAVSTLLEEFSLNYKNLNETTKKMKELMLAQRGNMQLSYDLKTIENKSADLTLFVGNLNEDLEAYKNRSAILTYQGFIADFKDVKPTTFDPHLKRDLLHAKAVKKDYIYVKGPTDTTIQSMTPNMLGLTTFKKKVSSHQPTFATVKVLFQKK